jgi:hypothetical protein
VGPPLTGHGWSGDSAGYVAAGRYHAGSASTQLAAGDSSKLCGVRVEATADLSAPELSRWERATGLALGSVGRQGESGPGRVARRASAGARTAAAESWGLVAFEHAATGAPQIVPGARASAELWEGHALLLQTARQPDGASLVSPDDLAVALTRLHDDPRLRASLSARGYSLATAPRLR